MHKDPKREIGVSAILPPKFSGLTMEREYAEDFFFFLFDGLQSRSNDTMESMLGPSVCTWVVGEINLDET